MKTKPTEACKIIEESWYAIPYMGTDYQQDSDIVIDKKDVYEIAKKAFQEGQSSPKIKQLEWVEVWEGYEDAKTPFGHYVVRPAIDNKTFLMIDIRKVIQPYSTLNEAKAAAQRDFERRVKECLDL